MSIGQDVMAFRHFDFENCQLSTAYAQGSINCECGVVGESVFLDGQSEIRDTSDFAKVYPSTADFTINFYFRPTRQNGNFILLSKRAQCSNNNFIQITFEQPARRISISVAQDVNNFVTMVEDLPEGTCWYMVTLVKRQNTIFLYINGELISQERSAGGNLRLGTDGPWIIGSGPCVGSVFKRFVGNIDEFQFYAVPLNVVEIRELYFQPDIISQRDTTIFLGDTLDLSVPNSCANSLFWSPFVNMTERMGDRTMVYPDVTTTYAVDSRHDACEARDTVRIVVVDPSELDCEDVFLANAFTPNGDGKNELFKIDNPIIVSEIINFQVFDRWGGIVFETTDIYEGWDGTIGGENALPGVYLYKVLYDCNGVEKIVNGSVTLIR